MVTIKQKISPLTDGSIDLTTWLKHFSQYNHIKNIDLIHKSASFAAANSQGLTTFYGQPCLEQGLEMADLLLNMQLDTETAAASIIVGISRQVKLDPETLNTHFSKSVTQLIQNVLQMDVLDNLDAKSHIQIDRLRKTFIAMAGDIRAVLIRLAERTCIMRGIKHINAKKRARIAEETMNIYAPLANRLGIGQLKWELEDTAFHFMHPDIYHDIAVFLAEKRIDREKHIEKIIHKLKSSLESQEIKATVYGRVKHIYSIFLKTQRKQANYNQIYDCSAVRILVSSIEECYAALSVAHETFIQIPEEFDDYISNPKPNGYRSIHTAVKDKDNRILEIQIRTTEMHDEAEHGVAAHWMYKETRDITKNQEERIRFIRQLLAWQNDVTKDYPAKDMELIDDTIYVFTPNGEIIDLPKGATPLDFAYKIHTELGHRCRGAKINGNIVQLTKKLQTGDNIEIITVAKGGPGKDWLNRTAGYITTARARAKIAHWIRQQNSENITLNTPKNLAEKKSSPTIKSPKKTIISQQIPEPKIPSIAEIHDFLTRIALCCNPTGSDKIVGYITKGRGISIHKTTCNNILTAQKRNSQRIISINWNKENK